MKLIITLEEYGMDDFRELMQFVLNMNYDNRLELGREQLRVLKRKLIPAARKNGINIPQKNEDSSFTIMMLTCIRQFVAANGEFNDDEFYFLCDLFETSFNYDKLLAFFNEGLKDSYESDPIYRKLIRSCGNEAFEAYCIIGVLICCSDGTCSVDEQRILRNILY